MWSKPSSYDSIVAEDVMKAKILAPEIVAV
jgi:hypothetical protein